MMIGRRTLLALATAVALVAPAQAERWTGFAYSDNGATLRIVIRGPAGLNADGSVQLVGVFRCLGPTCIAHRGTASALFWNEAGTGLGHETVEITHGFTPWFETGFYVFTSIQPGRGWEWVGDHVRPRVRIPVNAKNAGRRRTVATCSSCRVMVRAMALSWGITAPSRNAPKIA